MNTDKRFLNYKKYDNFQRDLVNGAIPEDAIVFIQEGEGCIWARGKEYLGGVGRLVIADINNALNGKADKSEIPTIPVLAKVATTGDYKDLNNKPTISNLFNDAGYITESQANQLYQLKGESTSDSGIDEDVINAKLQTLQEYLANQYVLKKDIQHPETDEWSKADIYPFGEIPEADVDNSRRHANIVAVDEDVFDVSDIQPDVCYFIYKKS